MKTILLISPYWKEQHRWMVSSYKLAELWQRMGYRVVVVCMGNTVVSGKWEEKSDMRCQKAESRRQKAENVEKVSDTLTVYRVKDLFLPDPFNTGIAPTFLWHLLRAIRIEKPDIVVVNKVLFWSSLWTPLLRLIGKKPILLTDALVGMTWWPRGFFPKILTAIAAWTAGWMVLLSASKVVFFHPQPEKLLKILGIRRKSRVIPTGVDVARHWSARRLSSGEVSSDERRTIITYVGRLESVKGVDDFLAALAPLANEHVKVQVVGWYKKDHALVAQYRDRVTFTGLREDIPAIMAATDIFVLPSYSEGLSNALMEAMASSCACIATEVGGNRFLIENGISGLLFPPGDRAMLRRHCERLIDDAAKRRALADAARKRMETMFSWKVVEKRYGELFGEE